MHMLKNNGFEIIVASPPEYDRLVAEIFFAGKFFALVSQERGCDSYDIETPGINLDEGQIVRKVDLEEFLKTIKEACQRLKN